MGLPFNLNRFGGARKKPYYCEVEYIESNGTQYIDTGVLAKSGTSSILNFEYTNLSSTSSMLDARLGNDRFYCCHAGKPSSDYYFYYGYGSARQSSVIPVINKRYVIETDLSINSQSMKVNGTTILTGNSTVYYNLGVNLYLFAMNYSTAQYLTSAKLYSCKIMNEGYVVRDFIPVLDWNYTACLYDKITGKLFYNQGTGSFTYGREIHYVDYLESTGTQYIDTGVKLTNNHSVELDYQLTQASQSRAGLYGNLATARYGTLLSPSNQYLEFGYGTSNLWYQMGLPDTNRHVIKQTKNNIYFDGSLLTSFTYTTFSIANTAPLGSFGYTAYTPAKAKYYGSRWWLNDTLIRDYKPAIDENGVAFWFDKVSHSIYDNAGTDAFKYPARKTEYIEVTDLGTNNQSPCIDLGLKYKPSMSIESKYTRTAMGAYGSVLPLSNSTTQPLIYMPALNASAKTDRFVWRRQSLPEASYYYDFADYPVTIEFKVDAVNDVLTVNNNVVKTGMIAAMNGYESPYESNSNLYMLSINGTYGGMGKVYYLKLYDATQVYRDLVPVWKDGVACMYDKQNNVYYSNTKTGTVTAGKIIESEWE